MDYREFVTAYLRTHRPDSPAEARTLMRQAAAEWRKRRGNPHLDSDGVGYFKAGFAGGLGLAVGLVGVAAVLCLLTQPQQRCPYC